VLTTQYRYNLLATYVGEEDRLPLVPTAAQRKKIAEDASIDPEKKKPLLSYLDKMLTGFVYIETGKGKYGDHDPVGNLHLSECYNCKKLAVWIFDRLVFPSSKSGVLPNSDLPETITADFEEAREIVQASPRGAAALLRLAIQKLCSHLGEKGKNIDDDIASLVRKGLNPLVQQSLDIVRVIGNEAVHPGTLDLSDDRDTAFRLFELVNAIADQMISHPKTVTDMYGKLPEGKRKAIELRDGKGETHDVTPKKNSNP
jgi:hypothetical protein